MPRLLIHVEGETEETFVNEVLRNHLISVGYQVVSARIVGNARLRHRRGGIRGWDSVKKDILRHLRGDRESFSSTMVDFYGLPGAGSGGWPGRAEASVKPSHIKASTVEHALSVDLKAEMAADFEPHRFIPFVVMHEFEGLLFSDCAAFSNAIGKPELEPAFQAIRNSFSNPEEINDSPLTAPSKRILDLMPYYQKPLLGTLGILEIGLARLQSECPHFAEWLQRLETAIQ